MAGNCIDFLFDSMGGGLLSFLCQLSLILDIMCSEGMDIDIYTSLVMAAAGDTEALGHFSGGKGYSGMTRVLLEKILVRMRRPRYRESISIV